MARAKGQLERVDINHKNAENVICYYYYYYISQCHCILISNLFLQCISLHISIFILFYFLNYLTKILLLLLLLLSC